MKKTLLATSALAFAGAMAAGSAAAADKVSVGLSGYMEQWIGMTNLDNGDGGVGIRSDSEFYVSGALAADNGLTFSVKIQVEGNSSANMIDESSATVSGSFGKVTLGADNEVSATMHAGHQDVGIGLNHGDVGWLSGISTGGTNGWFGDSKKISYQTPRISGVQFGMSYTPDTSSENSNISPENNDMNAWAVAVNVQQSLGDASVEFSVGHYNQTSGATESHEIEMGSMDMAGSLTRAAFDMYTKTWGDFETQHTTGVAVSQSDAAMAKSMLAATPKAMVTVGTDDSTMTNAGLRVGFGAFGVNVAYATYDKPRTYGVMDDDIVVIGDAWDHDDNADTADVAQTVANNPDDDIVRQMVVADDSADSDVMTIGAQYSDGPMAASVGYLLNEGGDGSETEAVMASFSYMLAPGVESRTSIFSADNGMDAGTGFVTGIKIGF